jgi:hypothetical protein
MVELQIKNKFTVRKTKTHGVKNVTINPNNNNNKSSVNKNETKIFLC